MKEIKGFKAFDRNIENLNEGILVSSIKYNEDLINSKFSFAKNMEDSLKFQVNAVNKENPIIAQVTGIGDTKRIDSEYYEFFNLYNSKDILIDKIFTEKEIIEQALNLSQDRMERFVSMYHLTDEQMQLFKNRHINVDLAMLYFQKNILDVYKLYYESIYSAEKQEKIKQLIKNI